nr:hypothetical protein [Actinomadura madurae]
MSDSAPPTNRANSHRPTSGRDSVPHSASPAANPRRTDGSIPDAASSGARRPSPGVRAPWSRPAPTRNM